MRGVFKRMSWADAIAPWDEAAAEVAIAARWQVDRTARRQPPRAESSVRCGDCGQAAGDRPREED